MMIFGHNLKDVVELGVALIALPWIAWMEVRFRTLTSQNQELKYALAKEKNKEAVKAESDSSALAELQSNLRSNS